MNKSKKASELREEAELSAKNSYNANSDAIISLISAQYKKELEPLELHHAIKKMRNVYQETNNPISIHTENPGILYILSSLIDPEVKVIGVSETPTKTPKRPIGNIEIISSEEFMKLKPNQTSLSGGFVGFQKELTEELLHKYLSLLEPNTYLIDFIKPEGTNFELQVYKKSNVGKVKDILRFSRELPEKTYFPFLTNLKR